MQGLVFTGHKEVELRDFTKPIPGPGEVVIAVKASGLCGSDLHQYRASDPSGCIVGHEPCGTIDSTGPGVDPRVAAVGDRVTIHHYAGCTVCDQCRAGWFQLCRRTTIRYGADANGSHAQYMLAPAVTVVKIDDTLSYEAGAAIGCGTGTAWGAIQRLGNIGGKSLIVFGQGPVGLSATMLATAMGAHVIAIDVEATRLERAIAFGASATVDATTTDPHDAIMELTNGRGASHVLETSGAARAGASALASLEPWGRVCFLGLGGAPVELNVRSLMRTQATIMTSWTLSIVELARCLEFITERDLPVSDLFSHRWRLDQAEEAYAEFDKQNAGKGVFLFG